MKNELMNLVYSSNDETRAVRVVVRDGEPWFVLSDVCVILGIANSRDVLRRLEQEDTGVDSIDTNAGSRTASTVNEAGLYMVILGARANDQTRAFQRWVTREVLPSIRKTGSYIVPGIAPMPPVLATPAQVALQIAQAVVDVETRTNALESRTDNLEQRLADEPLRSTEINVIHKLGQQLGKAMGNYPDAWKLFKNRFQLASYRDLPRREFENGKTFLERQINAWNDAGDQSPLVKA